MTSEPADNEQAPLRRCTSSVLGIQYLPTDDSILPRSKTVFQLQFHYFAAGEYRNNYLFLPRIFGNRHNRMRHR